MPHRTAATMSQCSNAVAIASRFAGLCRSQCSSFAKPHSDEYDAAAPLDRFEARPVRSLGDLVPPLPRRDDRTRGSNRPAARGACSTGITLEPVVSIAIASIGSPSTPAAAMRLARGGDQRLHVIGMALRRVIRDLPSCGAADTPPYRDPSRPFTLSTIETRTLRVPKSTPATIAIDCFNASSPG